MERLSEIAKELKATSNENVAFFGFLEWTDHEFCIKANNDGLKLLAATLLEATEIKTRGQSYGLNSEEVPWFTDELGIDFISWTDQPRSELEAETKESSKSMLWISIGLTIISLIVLYLIIVGIIYTIKLI